MKLKQKINTKRIPIVISPDVLKFLEIITQPADLKYTASHADFIRNNVLGEVRRKVLNAYNKNCY